MLVFQSDVTPGGWYASSHARGIWYGFFWRIHIKRKWLLDDYIFQQPHDWFESYKTSLFMESARWVAKVVQMEYIHLTIHGVSDVKGIFNLITSRFSYSLSMVCVRFRHAHKSLNYGQIISFWMLIPLMEEILHHLRCINRFLFWD